MAGPHLIFWRPSCAPCNGPVEWRNLSEGHTASATHNSLPHCRCFAGALATDDRVPSSRQLLAVPFVGKDVPSRASEWSHPDVLIGLTLAAYRYEGLRRDDVLQVCG